MTFTSESGRKARQEQLRCKQSKKFWDEVDNIKFYPSEYRFRDLEKSEKRYKELCKILSEEDKTIEKWLEWGIIISIAISVGIIAGIGLVTLFK